ncbi:MAG: DUF362 domain-containing protein [Bryobacteraceae bacterium]|nr:DUF362 domain-containing protein [Bryobacteraceae bacterium]
MNRRHFLMSTGAAAMLQGAEEKTRLGLVRSTHARLRQPAPLDQELSDAQVREMVFRAIELGSPGAGSLEAKIRPGSWLVIKPNIVFLRPHPAYAKGDITDFRVTRAVLEYVATRSRASRITIAEGGTYRRPNDKAEDNVVTQGGQRVNALNFDWGVDEFPGFDGSLGGMIQSFARRFPDKKFDYVDLSYDAVRDPGGAFRRIEAPKAPNGVGAFGDRPDYFVTNTITKCDFLITVPVMKVHLQSGITACLKNYVGTAPREAYSRPGVFHNAKLHEQHSAGGRIDPFIVDLASFHPPDYCVVDGLRGLQCQEHSIQRDDQTVRSNLILAGEDPVAADAITARLLGFQETDMEFLHMASRRQMGTMDMARIDVRGDEPDRDNRRWEKPGNWYGRCNRLWKIARGPEWVAHEARFDTLDLPQATGIAPAAGVTYKVAAQAHSPGHGRGHLWMGLRGKVVARLNGLTVAEFECGTRYRVGQFQFPVTLQPGTNRFEFHIQPLAGQAMLSVLVTGRRNDGDTLERLRWAAV